MDPIETTTETQPEFIVRRYVGKNRDSSLLMVSTKSPRPSKTKTKRRVYHNLGNASEDYTRKRLGGDTHLHCSSMGG